MKIRQKIVVSFSTVILISLLLLTYIIGLSANESNEKIVKNQMVETKKDIELYLRQYFMMNNLTASAESFAGDSAEISKELSYKLGSRVEIYNKDNKILTASAKNLWGTDNEDLRQAEKGKSAYRISEFGEEIIARLSVPIIIDKKPIGIIRCSRNYTELYESSEILQKRVKIFVLVMFVVILLIAYFIARVITRPIYELTAKMSSFAEGDMEVEVSIASRDEIGQLAQTFKHMVEKIRYQMNVIISDREQLKNMNLKRKEFFDHTAHELKTPITTVLGYAGIIKDNGFSDKEFFDKGINKIIEEGQRLSHVVENVLELSKGRDENYQYYFEEFDLGELIQGTCSDMEIKARKYGMSIQCFCSEGIKLFADREKIKEVLINIIDNSIKYANVDSVVLVEVSKEEKAISIKVKDAGEGMEEEVLNNIFEPFYRATENKASERGSCGLGLSITKAIVEKHKGTINIKSVKGSGTEVEVLLFNDLLLKEESKVKTCQG